MNRIGLGVLAALTFVFGLSATVSPRAQMLVGGGYEGAAAGGHRCQAQVEAQLQQLGMKMSEMSEIRWYTDTFAKEGSSKQVAGFRFYGRPKSCTSGSVQVTLWDNCGVQNVRTRGGCEVAGVSC